MGLTTCVRPGHGGTIVGISGDIDGGSAAVFEELLLQIMRMHGAPLLLDLSGVTFMDCAGLRAVFTIRRLGEARERRVHLVAASAAIRRLAELTHTQDDLGLPAPDVVPAQAPAVLDQELNGSGPAELKAG
ncbi:MAG: STAS domain-containing protein [Streptosporangiaceae bacterium]|nr:STAS domain-containing protein [Streptosporangiaceae bacterium]MBV9857433.1 STAS domain-containing protein [Streptosporangiaceae bacterium]